MQFYFSTLCIYHLLGCLTNKAIGIYKSLARYSGGQILYFSDKRQIASTTRFIQKGLIGGSSIPVTPARLIKKGRTKRGIIAMEYSITVDDSIDVLSTSIMDRSNIDAQLYSPGNFYRELLLAIVYLSWIAILLLFYAYFICHDSITTLLDFLCMASDSKVSRNRIHSLP